MPRSTEGAAGDAQGRLQNPGFLDYRMPVASDLPAEEVEDHPVETLGLIEVWQVARIVEHFET